MAEVPEFGERIAGRKVIPRPSAYGLIRNADDEYAIVRTKRGLFLPGGAIEPGEDARQAVVRETREECGILVRPTREVARAIQLVHVRGGEITFEKQSAFWRADLVRADVAEPELGSELLWLLAEVAVRAMFHESQAWVLRTLGET